MWIHGHLRRQKVYKVTGLQTFKNTDIFGYFAVFDRTVDIFFLFYFWRWMAIFFLLFFINKYKHQSTKTYIPKSDMF